MTYVFASISWNCHKWLKRKKVKHHEPIEFHEPSRADSSGLEAELLLGKLDDYDAWLIRYRVLEGYTFPEIAEALEVPLAVARRQVNQAINRARGILADDV